MGSLLLLQTEVQISPTGASSLIVQGLGKGLTLEGSKAEVPAAQPGHPRELTDTCSAPSMPRGAVVVREVSAVSNFRQVWPNGINLFWSTLFGPLSGSPACTHTSCLVPEFLFLLPFNICTIFAISHIWHAMICYFRVISGFWKKFLLPAGFHLSCHAFCCHSRFPGAILLFFPDKKCFFCIWATFSLLEHLFHVE